MEKLKQWVALTVVGVLAIGAGGWFLVISPKRQDAVDLRTQAASKEATNRSLETTLSQLKAQQKQLPAEQAKLAKVAAKIPDNPALPGLVRALSNAADAAGVELVSMSPAAPIAVTAATSAKTATATTTAAGKGASTPARSPAAASAATGSLEQIGVTLNVVGSYFQVEEFLSGLEDLQRAFKVSGITLAPGSNPLKPSTATAATTGRSLTAAVTGAVYMAQGRIATPTTAK
ncbi:MAG: hypothetical protein JWP14_944 [Frankiales bacterium]|nr:hypothetical protein [Frankiales bacterium]